MFARLRPPTTVVESRADSREDVTPAPYEDDDPCIDGDGICDWGGDAECVLVPGERSSFSGDDASAYGSIIDIRSGMKPDTAGCNTVGSMASMGLLRKTCMAISERIGGATAVAWKSERVWPGRNTIPESWSRRVFGEKRACWGGGMNGDGISVGGMGVVSIAPSPEARGSWSY